MTISEFRLAKLQSSTDGNLNIYMSFSDSLKIDGFCV